MNNIHTKQTPKRKHIPKILKIQVWDKYNGRENGIAPCYCCKKMIDSKNFEAGHIKSVSSGGKTCLNNLRPICRNCNVSMGANYSIDEWNSKFRPNKRWYFLYLF